MLIKTADNLEMDKEEFKGNKLYLY
ncbi:hypothetical protein E2C01_101180 [Portunus trituberculatus]|uniref:Uncharacterized protein n=1 Tax=Portunus trituberculatus TaxID=210409 RepID=A0A5B7KEZ0_PORTR|nr:hypothetical protein [Portunus trituberculatus]